MCRQMIYCTVCLIAAVAFLVQEGHKADACWSICQQLPADTYVPSYSAAPRCCKPNPSGIGWQYQNSSCADAGWSVPPAVDCPATGKYFMDGGFCTLGGIAIGQPGWEEWPGPWFTCELTTVHVYDAQFACALVNGVSTCTPVGWDPATEELFTTGLCVICG